jgi:hypothetical protein
MYLGKKKFSLKAKPKKEKGKKFQIGEKANRKKTEKKNNKKNFEK